MSKISIKTDFQDGTPLPAQDLNNNFGVIEAAFNHNEEYYEEILQQAISQLDTELEKITANRGWDWNGSTLGQRVVFFKGTTEEIEAQPIINGQTLCNTVTGETAIDSDGKRINTGSGNVIAVQEDEPKNEATKLWIEDDFIGSPATEVVDSMEGEDINLAPSVRATKDYVDDKFNYSTNEVRIGKWIDGKPLYRKTILFNYVSNHTNTIPTNLRGINDIWIDLSNSFIKYEGTRVSPLVRNDFRSTNQYSLGVIIDTTTLNVTLQVGECIPNGTGAVTVTYTKITDEEVSE